MDWSNPIEKMAFKAYKEIHGVSEDTWHILKEETREAWRDMVRNTVARFNRGRELRGEDYAQEFAPQLHQTVDPRQMDLEELV